MRTIWIVTALPLALGAALALGAVRAKAARADDEKAAANEGLEWISGWEAGKARAEKEGKLIFLYFARHVPS